MGYQLRSCVWEITLACCFSCKYCGSNGGKARENELSTEECLSVVQQLHSLGCRRVSLIGGEVFMRRDWPEIVCAMTSCGMRVAIITNGFLLTDTILNTIRSCGVESVAVSLDGLEAVHDKYRQEGSYHRAVNAIHTLAEHQIPVSVISTLNAETAAGLEDFYSTLSTFPIKACQIQACSPMGNAATGGINYRFDPGHVMGFVEKHRDIAIFTIGTADNIGYYGKNEYVIRGRRGAAFRGCSAGLTTIGIDSIGNVRGCESMYDDYIIEGNLWEKSLREIWEAPNAFAYNRKFTIERLTGRCLGCEYGAFCAGGCRSYNFFVHKKPYESAMCRLHCEPHAEAGIGGF